MSGSEWVWLQLNVWSVLVGLEKCLNYCSWTFPNSAFKIWHRREPDMGDGIATASLLKAMKAAANVGFSPVETAETVPATDGLGAFIYSGTVSVLVPAHFCLQWKDVVRTLEQLCWVKDTSSPVSCLWQWLMLSQKKSSKSSSRGRAFSQ